MTDGGWQNADGKRHMEKWGWKNERGKMRMEKCAWKNGKMRMKHCGWKSANDKYTDGKLLARGIISRCFLTVLVLDKPGQLILNQGREPRLQFFTYSRNIYLITKQIEIFLRRIQEKEETWSNNHVWIITKLTIYLHLRFRRFLSSTLSSSITRYINQYGRSNNI